MENNIMKEITLDNFEAEYEDSIEQQQIDKFVAAVRWGQIHRYIKVCLVRSR